MQVKVLNTCILYVVEVHICLSMVLSPCPHRFALPPVFQPVLIETKSTKTSPVLPLDCYLVLTRPNSGSRDEIKINEN